jgi:hypothetical protein
MACEMKKGVTIKDMIEQALHRKTGRTASLDALLQDLPGLTREQLCSGMNYLSKQGRVSNQGTTRNPAWMLIAQISHCNLGDLSASKPRKPIPSNRQPEIVWPDHVKVQLVQSSFRVEPYKPEAAGYRRPDGDDHLKCPSLHVGVRRPHTGQPLTLGVRAK